MLPTIPGLTDTRRCHCLEARRRARAITRLYEEALRPVGLRATQFSVLAALAQIGSSPLTPLAELLGAEISTLTRSVDLLSRRGLLADVASADRRQRAVRLTREGASLLQTALPLWRGVQDGLDSERSTGDARGE
ncbi:MAG: MarR family transcriptional regulator [Trueperaceae bacterium]|nr:MarR family transcriptional regulator [Trueperaceae bacterium]